MYMYVGRRPCFGSVKERWYDNRIVHLHLCLGGEVVVVKNPVIK